MRSIRQVPTNEDFNKKSIDARIYGYFQTESYLGATEDGEEVRFVYRNNFTNEGLSKVVQISVSQTQRNIRTLKAAGFIIDGKVWNKERTALCNALILTEYSDKIQYIRLDTLRELVYIANKDMIKVYASLLGWYEYKKSRNKTFIFTKKQLIEHCFGMKSTSHQRDYDEINAILKGLVLLGLIEYRNIVCDSPEHHLHYRMELLKVNKTVKEVVIETVQRRG